jgi:hypothetical protein
MFSNYGSRCFYGSIVLEFEFRTGASSLPYQFAWELICGVGMVVPIPLSPTSKANLTKFTHLVENKYLLDFQTLMIT